MEIAKNKRSFLENLELGTRVKLGIISEDAKIEQNNNSNQQYSSASIVDVVTDTIVSANIDDEIPVSIRDYSFLPSWSPVKESESRESTKALGGIDGLRGVYNLTDNDLSGNEITKSLSNDYENEVTAYEDDSYEYDDELEDDEPEDDESEDIQEIDNISATIVDDGTEDDYYEDDDEPEDVQEIESIPPNITDAGTEDDDSNSRVVTDYVSNKQSLSGSRSDRVIIEGNQNIILDGSSCITANEGIKDNNTTSSKTYEDNVDSGIIFIGGMSLDSFLRKNPSLRSKNEILEYFSTDEVAESLKLGIVQFNTRKQKFFI